MGSNNDAVLLAALAIVSTAMLLQGWIIKFLFQKLLPIMETVAKTSDKAAHNIEENNKLTRANTEATKAADKYLRERNGRDAEIHKKLVQEIGEIPKAMQEISDRNLAEYKKAIKPKIEHQDIKQQNVEQMTIKKTDA